jgi:hypothetical protein
LRSVEGDRSERRRAVSSPARLQEQGPHAILAAAFAAGSALLLPFFPGGWPFLLGAIAALLALVNPRVGLAAALAVPVLPLGNVSLGLALAYVPLAVAWLVLFARDARSGLLFVAGPVLALLHLLPLLPVVALQARGAVRQAALALAGVLAAAGAAIAAGARLPLTGEDAPDTVSLRGTERPAAAFDAVASLLTSSPTMLVVALVVVAATLAARPAREHGLWGVAGWGAGFVGALLLAPLAVGGEPVAAAWAVPAAWLATGALAYPLLRERR